MLGRSLLVVSAFCLTSVPATAKTDRPDDSSQDGVSNDDVGQRGKEIPSQSYGDRNRGGPYGFYSYPRHRHVDRGGLDRRPSSSLSAGTSAHYDRSHGSAYYGRDYGAPYFDSGYYDRGVYYRERRD